MQRLVLYSPHDCKDKNLHLGILNLCVIFVKLPAVSLALIKVVSALSAIKWAILPPQALHTPPLLLQQPSELTKKKRLIPFISKDLKMLGGVSAQHRWARPASRRRSTEPLLGRSERHFASPWSRRSRDTDVRTNIPPRKEQIPRVSRLFTVRARGFNWPRSPTAPHTFLP